MNTINVFCLIIMVMTAKTSHNFILPRLGLRIFEYVAHVFTVLNASSVIQRLMDENNCGQRRNPQICADPMQLFFGNISLVAFALASGVISIKNHDMHSLIVKRVVSAWHPQKSDRLLTRVSTIHIVVPEHMISRSSVLLPGLKEFPIAFMGATEVAKLANEICLSNIHCFCKGFNAMRCIMHYILVNIRNKAKP